MPCCDQKRIEATPLQIMAQITFDTVNREMYGIRRLRRCLIIECRRCRALSGWVEEERELGRGVIVKFRVLAMYAILAAALPGQVTFDRLLHPEREPQNWLTYSG